MLQDVTKSIFSISPFLLDWKDIVFGAEFDPCMSSENGVFTVDMKRFHQTCESRSHAFHSDSSLKKQSNFIATRDESFLSTISERTEEDGKGNTGDDGDEETGDGVYYRRSYATFDSIRA